ncbi:hypothetical protein NP493_772g02023 [Ridgeia piscesae]|uniref:Uncharacterized protein n=1 Tax=Ridgeia piscesae TaxID=27915 RepID=A0AAD9NNE5_RIDPI|nr:hypothetical protein NP493_772g02023 [Ridgeia piscesae]
MSALFLIESIASVWSASICCRSVCCRHRPTTAIPVGYQAQTGQVLMAMVNPAHMTPQPVQGMAPPPSAPYGWQGAPAAYAENPVSFGVAPSVGLLFHFGAGFFLIVTGMMGIAVVKLKTVKPMVYFSLMSGVASLGAIGFFFAMVKAALLVSKDRMAGDEQSRFIVAEVYVFLALYLFTALISGFSAVYTFSSF